MIHVNKLRWCVLLAAYAVGTACVGAVDGQAPSLLQFMKERQARRYDHVPREVLAFYYTWYGRPERQGHWVHWGGERPESHDIPESIHYPAQGAYDSHDPAIIDRHIDLAKSHGLTGFIATWWGPGGYDDRAFATLLARAGQKGFKVTVYWETAPGEGAAQIDRAVADLLYVLQWYGSADAFLKVDGNPVVFVYGRVMDQVPLKSWPAIIQRTRQQYGRDFALIADGYTEAYARLFDGVHTYNICGWVQGKSPDELRQPSAASFASAVRLAKSHGGISCVTVIPGYDDTFIKLTGEYAQRFRATAASQIPIPDESTGLAPKQAELLRELYRGKTIGVLPDYSGQAVFWLAEVGIPLEELSWPQLLDPQVLDPKQLPMIVYAGGEHYVRTVHKDGDVEAALQRYLSGGGMLIACDWQPSPFHYDQTGQPNVASRRLGLPINGSGPVRQSDKQKPAFVRSWETPPKDVELTFYVDSQRLPGLPATVAFPTIGDQRWRPATEAMAAPGDVYWPLARLRDAHGNCYGDGIVYIEHRVSPPVGGRNLYVWMRMPDLLGTNETFFSLFRFATTSSTSNRTPGNPAD